jgi:hypothetical protein
MPEQFPSLGVRRPITGLSDSDIKRTHKDFLFHRVQQAASVPRQVMRHVSYTAPSKLQVVLLHQDELASFHKRIGLEVDQDHIKSLAADLNDTLPSLLRDSVELAVLPTVVDADPQISGRWRLMIAINQEVQAERQIVRKAVQTSYGLAAAASEAWPADRQSPGVEFAYSRFPEAERTLIFMERRLNANPDVLTQSMTAGPPIAQSLKGATGITA